MDYRQDYEENKRQVEIYRKKVIERYKKFGKPLPIEDWERPELKVVLRHVLFEP